MTNEDAYTEEELSPWHGRLTTESSSAFLTT